jgi:hypothetical protein
MDIEYNESKAKVRGNERIRDCQRKSGNHLKKGRKDDKNAMHCLRVESSESDRNADAMPLNEQ